MNMPISTWLGNQLDPLNATVYDFDIEDIAHHLGNICRYNGGVDEHYSVAQHSILLAEMVPARLKRAAMLHDAAEYVLGDCISPVKALFPEFRKLEQRILAKIMERFDVPWNEEIEAELKKYELVLKATEKRDLKTRDRTVWEDIKDVVPLPAVIKPLNNHTSKMYFLRYFQMLQNEYKGSRFNAA